MLGLLNVLKVIVIMVTELTHGQMETNTLGNGKMANKRHGKGTHKKISVSKESVGRGAKSLSNIVAIVFGLTTGVPFGFMVAGSGGWSGFATIVVIIICFFVVYYFWKFVFWGLRSLISEFFN